MPLSNKDATNLIIDLKESSWSQMSQLATYQARGGAYFLGRQWRGTRRVRNHNFGELTTNFNPEAGALRVTNNIITTFTQLSEAATHPFGLPFRVQPYHSDMTTEALGKARAAEFVLEADKRESKRLAAVARGNFLASIFGSHLIGLEHQRFTIDGTAKGDDGKLVKLDEIRLRWRELPALSLMLDPSETAPNLREHENVGYRQIFSVRQFETMFGRKLSRADRDNLRSISELAEHFTKVGSISGGHLYGEYIRQSRMKAVEVFFVYRKSGRFPDRFDEMYAYWEKPENGEMQPVTEEAASAVNPYGYDGLPYALMNYHQRPGTPFGAGATHLMIGQQDLINLSETIFARGLAYSSTPTWIMDKRGKPNWKGGQNRVGGTVYWQSGMQGDKVFPPQSIRTADPNPQHVQQSERLQGNARAASHRSPINQGLTKSHVPDASNQAALNESNSVPNIIVENYANIFSQLLLVELGTKARAVQAGSLGMIRRWQQRGLTIEDFTAFRQIDPIEINLEVSVERDAIRPRAPQSRRAEIIAAADPSIQMLTNIESRRALVRDAEMPLTSSDRQMEIFTQRKVERIVAGEEWVPIRFGSQDQHNWIILAFSDALVSITNGDEAAEGRLRKAIDEQSRLQTELAQQEAAIQNPQAGVQAPELPPTAGGVSVPTGNQAQLQLAG